MVSAAEMVCSGCHEKPGVSVGTTKIEIPLCLGTSGSVRAASQMWVAKPAREVNTFWPLMTHSSPSRTALVCSEARSVPEPGSV